MIRRLIDVSCALALLPFLLATIPFMWLCTRAGSYPGLFFRQERVGFRGKKIQILKFCSLKMERGSLRAGPLLRLARRTGVDELPQLLLVLRGDMSCVGPRPLLAKDLFSSDMGGHGYVPALVDRRLSVKPGMTGVAQIGHRNRAWSEGGGPALFLKDLWYVENRSILLDLLILAFTPIYAITLGRLRFPVSAAVRISEELPEKSPRSA
ncbi:MAG: sugar transferase [Candidatus Eisenbacteria bacterium]